MAILINVPRFARIHQIKLLDLIILIEMDILLLFSLFYDHSLFKLLVLGLIMVAHY